MWNPTELRYTQLRGQADTEAQLRFAPYSSTAKATHALFRMAAPRLALSVFVLMLAAITLSEGREFDQYAQSLGGKIILF